MAAKKKNEKVDVKDQKKVDKTTLKAEAKKEFESTMKTADATFAKAEKAFDKADERFKAARKTRKETRRVAKAKRKTVIKQTAAWIGFGVVTAVTVIAGIFLASGKTSDEGPEFDSINE